MTKIKICGIQDTSSAMTAYAHGADYLGFVFANSKRQITPDKTKEIIKRLPLDILKVGVFVNCPTDEMIAIADFCGLDLLQLHGQETYENYRYSSYPIIKSVSIKSSELNVPKADYLLFDTWHKSMAGGSGKTFDWNYLENYKAKTPYFLAGGLNKENVAKAIKCLSPFAVDVSSGVETDGIKDIKKIIEFIKNVKECQNYEL